MILLIARCEEQDQREKTKTFLSCNFIIWKWKTLLFITKYVGRLYRGFLVIFVDCKCSNCLFYWICACDATAGPNKPMTTGHVLQKEKSCFHYRIRPDWPNFNYRPENNIEVAQYAVFSFTCGMPYHPFWNFTVRLVEPFWLKKRQEGPDTQDMLTIWLFSHLAFGVAKPVQQVCKSVTTA